MITKKVNTKKPAKYMSQKKRYSPISGTLLAFLLIPLFLIPLLIISGCSSQQNESTYVEFANPASALKQKSLSRDFDFNTIDSLIISIENTSGRILSSIDAINSPATIKLPIPSNTTLIVSGNAYTNNLLTEIDLPINELTDEELSNATLLYSGEVTLDPVSAGSVTNLTLLLQDLSEINNPIQIDAVLGEGSFSERNSKSTFSRDDSFVLFSSNDTTLLNNIYGSGIFLRDIFTNSLKNLHTNILGEVANTSDYPDSVSESDISADGIYAVFSSMATNLTSDIDSNDSKDVFLKNTITGEVTWISQHSTSIGEAQADSYNPQISDDGTIITFFSEAQIINGLSNRIFHYNRLTATLSSLVFDDASDNYKLSGDGTIIVYQIKNNGGLKIANISSSSSNDIERNSTDILNDGNLFGAITLPGPQLVSDANIDFDFNINQDGRFTLFIPAEDANGLSQEQIYLYDSITRTTKLVSKTRTNEAFSGILSQRNTPSISNDGRYVVFSYDNTTYVRSIEFNNLLKLDITEGSNPFVSSKGDKIGYEKTDGLFVIDNPLYVVDSTPTQKPEAPANFTLEDFGEAVELSWENTPNVSFYRIYQSFDPSIASTQLGDPSFLPIVYETTTDNLFIDLSVYLNSEITPYLYFIVVAINENGEGVASQEITNAPELPLATNNLTISSILDYSDLAYTGRPLTLFFSEPVDTASIEPSITLLDSSSTNIAFEYEFTATSVTIYPVPGLELQSSYTLQVNESLRAVNDSPLTNLYEKTFTTTDSSFDEGTLLNPVDIPGPVTGVVGFEGRSNYLIPLNSDTQSYIISLENETAALGINLISGDESTLINCSISANICTVEGITQYTELTLQVDGPVIAESSGASFDIVVSHLPAITTENTSLMNFTIDHAQSTHMLLTSLAPNTTYHLTDQTPEIAYDSFNLYSHLTPADECIILMGDGFSVECNFTTSSAGSLLLEADRGQAFSTSIRTYQLDIMPTLAYNPLLTPNNITITDQQYVQINNLRTDTPYYIDIASQPGFYDYQVSTDIDFSNDSNEGVPLCAGSTAGDSPVCQITPPLNGRVYLKLNQTDNSTNAQAIINLREVPQL